MKISSSPQPSFSLEIGSTVSPSQVDLEVAPASMKAMCGTCGAIGELNSLADSGA